MKINFKIRNTLAYLFCALLLMIPSYPAAAAHNLSKPFSQLEKTHMNLDDISEYLIYLNYRLAMDYKIALYANDLSFLKETEDIIAEMSSYFRKIELMNNCSGAALHAIKDLRAKLDDSLEIIDTIRGNGTTYETNSIKANEYRKLLSRIDQLEQFISPQMEADIVDSKLGSMIMGDIALSVRRIQQLNVRSFYGENVDLELGSIKAELDEIKGRIADNIERKTTDPELVKLKQKVYEELDEIYVECEAFVKEVQKVVESEETFSEEDEFITISNSIDKLIRTELLGAVFT